MGNVGNPSGSKP
jgi:hypothetical protein